MMQAVTMETMQVISGDSSGPARCHIEPVGPGNAALTLAPAASRASGRRHGGQQGGDFGERERPVVYAPPDAGRFVQVGGFPVAVPGEGHQEVPARVQPGSGFPEGVADPGAAGAGTQQLMLASDPGGGR